MKLPSKYFWLIALITCVSFSLRFEGLWFLEAPIFDEIFYPQYGFNYLSNEEFFYPHPPLANYLYAFSIWFYQEISWLFGFTQNITSFENLNPMSYRWLNGLMGSLLFIVIYRIAFSLSNNKVFALIASLFVAIDVAMIVDSRIATANVFLLFFGLCSMAIITSYERNKKNDLKLLLFSIFIGLTASIKWNGLGFFLMATSYYFLLFSLKNFNQSTLEHANKASTKFSLVNDISLKSYFIYFVLIPALIYSIIFIPDVYFNTQYDFFEKHKQMLGYHQIMVTENQHPYCSNWYTWPFMIKPIAYFFNSYDLPNNGISMIENIHLFPNPALSLLSFIAISIMTIHWLKLLYRWLTIRLIEKEFFIFSFILLGYFCNLLPWLLVNRCTFIYHYQPSAIFGFLALSWYLSRNIISETLLIRISSWSLLLIILISFLYWLPIQLGIPIENFQFYERMWFKSWI